MEATGDKQLQGSYITQELLKELNKVGNRLLIGIPCERKEGEKRLALTPEAVDMLTDRGDTSSSTSGNPVDETSFYCLFHGATQSVCSGRF